MELQCALACSPVLRRRSTIALMVATALALPLAGPHAGADSDDEAAERAAAEIAAARERANDAAAAYFDALSELDQLEDEAKRLAADAVKLERQVDALRDQVEQVAVNRFVSSGNAGIPLLSGVREPSERLQAEVLVAVVTESSAEAMDEFERASLELAANQHAVEENQEAVAEQKEEFLALQEQAEAEVVHLQEVEQQRLEDERVREALEARQREEQRQRELEAERQRQEAAEQAAEDAETESTAVPSAPEPAPDQGGGDARPTGGGSPPQDDDTTMTTATTRSPPRPSLSPTPNLNRSPPRLQGAAWCARSPGRRRTATPGVRHVRVAAPMRGST